MQRDGWQTARNPAFFDVQLVSGTHPETALCTGFLRRKQFAPNLSILVHQEFK